jgi:hypothetical protein
MPGKRFGAERPLAPEIDDALTKAFRSRPFSQSHVAISGVTRNNLGTPIGNCVVQLYRANDTLVVYFDPFPRFPNLPPHSPANAPGELHLESTSDASGNYIFYPSVSGPFYVLAYKAGSPDLAGTTVNTLQPTPV